METLLAPTPRVCPICGKPFFPRSEQSRQKYCSEKCSRIARQRSSKEQARKRLRNGIIPLQKSLLAYFNGYGCAVCGFSFKEDRPDKNAPLKFWIPYLRSLHGMTFHHIIPVKDGGEDRASNLICLCPNCHKMADNGAISKDLLLSKQLTRESFEHVFEQVKKDLIGNRSIESRVNESLFLIMYSYNRDYMGIKHALGIAFK